MQITVLGASGRVGRQVVARCLENGHTVKALVHSRNPFEHSDRLEIITGSIYTHEDIERAIEGSTVVISTLGSWGTKKKNVVSTAVESLIPSMKKQKIARLITLTGAGALCPGDTPRLIDKINRLALLCIAPRILKDGERHLVLLKVSGLEWTCIRSPIMTKSKRVVYRLVSVLPMPWATIPRAAVVAALIDQITDQNYYAQAPLIKRS